MQQVALPVVQVSPCFGAGGLFWVGTCAAKWQYTHYSGAGPAPFSSPAPTSPNTCATNAKENHYLRIDKDNKRYMATEEAFFAGNPVAWGLYEALKNELVWRYPEMEVRVAKTQVSFFDRLMFGCVSFTRVRRKAEMPAHFITLTLGLPEPVDSPRIAVKCEPYPGRWTHHIVLASADEIDAELLDWIDRAHQFAQR